MDFTRRNCAFMVFADEYEAPYCQSFQRASQTYISLAGQ
jgi:hypothetical protein